MRAKFENRSDIVRDIKNKAILYINKEKLMEYKAKKNLQNKYSVLTKEINIMRDEIKSLKSTLNEFLTCMKENIKNENGKND